MRSNNFIKCTLDGMKFEINHTDNEHDIINTKSNFYLTEDKSLLYQNNIGDYSVFLGGNWRFELIVDSVTNRCVKFQSYLGEIHVETADLYLPKSESGELLFKANEILSSGEGCHYIPFEQKFYYDEQKGLICIGVKNTYGDCIEFAPGIFATIEAQQLKSIYLKIPFILNF